MSDDEFQFQDLVDALEREKGSKTIQDLDDDFFREMRQFISDLEGEVSQTSQDINTLDRLGLDQLLKARKMSDTLINLRLKKIALTTVHVQMGLKKVNTDSMGSREIELFNDIKDLLEEAKGELKEGEYRRVQKEEEPPEPVKKTEGPKAEKKAVAKTKNEVAKTEVGESGEEILVHVTEDVPTFVDMETTYSLKKEDVVTLGVYLANVLIKKELARKVDLN